MCVCVEALRTAYIKKIRKNNIFESQVTNDCNLEETEEAAHTKVLIKGL